MGGLESLGCLGQLRVESSSGLGFGGSWFRGLGFKGFGGLRVRAWGLDSQRVLGVRPRRVREFEAFEKP